MLKAGDGQATARNFSPPTCIKCGAPIPPRAANPFGDMCERCYRVTAADKMALKQ